MLFRSLLLFLPLPALADAAAPAEKTLPPSSLAGGSDLAGSVGQMFFGLALVIVVLVGCLWLLKRLGAPRGSARGLKVLGAAPVGPRERVVLVEVGQKVLVLGVAPGQVNTLDTLSPDELKLTEPTSDRHEPGGFAQRLKQMLEANKHG